MNKSDLFLISVRLQLREDRNICMHDIKLSKYLNSDWWYSTLALGLGHVWKRQLPKIIFIIKVTISTYKPFEILLFNYNANQALYFRPLSAGSVNISEFMTET